MHKSRTSAAGNLSSDSSTPSLFATTGAKLLGQGRTQTKAQGNRMGFLSRKPPKDIDALSPDNPSLTPPESNSSHGKEKESSSDDHSTRFFSSLSPSSVIPDPLLELPPWFHTDTDGWSPGAAVSFRSRYPMHNPAGPRWYRNHHLLPPQENALPSQFSTSFPPMPSAAERSQESTRIHGISRTPSASPSPTPSSSQIRIMDPGGRVRTRKISQTDNVDMWDATDPTGQNWHHESPYDIGGMGERNGSPDGESPTDSKANRMSLNANSSRHRSVIPSPLSQSTSAIHLQVTEPILDPRIQRRLSKRRKPFGGLFGQSHDNILLHPASAPVSSELTSPIGDGDGSFHRKLLHRRSTADSPMASQSVASLHHDSGSKPKHSSLMGRLARRFSVMRKTDSMKVPESPVTNGIGNILTTGNHPDTDSSQTPTSPEATESSRSLFNGARSPAPSKRVPPPSIDVELANPTTNGTLEGVDHRQSVSSLDADTSQAVGKLTIVNPDEPSAVGDAPEVPSTPPTASSTSVYNDKPTDESEGQDSDMAPAAPPVTADPAESVESTPAVAEVTLPAPAELDPPQPEPSDTTSPSAVVELLPPTTISSTFDHSLPPTPKTERALSFVSDDPTTQSSNQSRHDTMSFAPSTIGFTAYAPSSFSVSLEDPALARASIVANPPTPQVLPVPMQPPNAPIPTQEFPKQWDASPTKTKESGKAKDGSLHAKSSSTTRRRETETFMLVRSPSGAARAAGDVIPALGEQWEVIESPSDTSTKRSRRKEISDSKDREAKKQETSAGTDAIESHRKRHRSVNDRPTVEHSPSVSRATRTPSIDTGRRPHAHEGESSSHRDGRPSARKEFDAEASRSTKTSVNYTHSPEPSRSHHERRGSASGRPVSGLQSSAEMNSVKARDAWEKERLWKARSMTYGPEGATVVPTPPTIADSSRPSTVLSAEMNGAGTIPSLPDLQRATSVPTHTPNNGSNHTGTFYMMQAPYQGSHTIPHTYIPAPPPPIIYTVPQPQQSSSKTSPPRRRQVSHSFSGRVPFPVSDRSPDPPSLTRNYIGNPLPDPPRISTYIAAPLPPSLANPSTTSIQYAGVPTRY